VVTIITTTTTSKEKADKKCNWRGGKTTEKVRKWKETKTKTKTKINK
jgi:hypothetical protein